MARKIFSQINSIDPDLKKMRIYTDFIVPLTDFIEKSFEFYAAVENLRSQVSQTELIQKYSKHNNKKNKKEKNYICSPLKNKEKPNNKETRLDKTLQIAVRKPETSSVVRNICEGNDGKILKGHCFLYETEDEKIESSWKDVLDLRGKIARLLWDEERNVIKKHF